eukprot:2164589-Rhodomonas_salina.1
MGKLVRSVALTLRRAEARSEVCGRASAWQCPHSKPPHKARSDADVVFAFAHAVRRSACASKRELERSA